MEKYCLLYDKGNFILAVEVNMNVIIQKGKKVLKEFFCCIDGDKYDGEWKNYKREGMDVFIFYNNEKYDGK